MIAGEAVPKPSRRAPDNLRASPEAIAKRRAARLFNEVVLGPGPRSADGRTERRRRRLLRELADGATRAGHELKPIDVLLRAQALLDLGEPIVALVAARPLPPPVKMTDALVDGVRRLHAAYAFAPEVYRFVGIDDGALQLAGVLKKKRGPVKAAPRTAPFASRRGAA
jgi:hypothetical protein